MSNIGPFSLMLVVGVTISEDDPVGCRRRAVLVERHQDALYFALCRRDCRLAGADTRGRPQVTVSEYNLAQFDAGETRYGTNLVYSNWVEGIDKRNKTSVFKGYHMFAKAHEHIDNNPKLYEKYIGDAIIEALE